MSSAEPGSHLKAQRSNGWLAAAAVMLALGLGGWIVCALLSDTHRAWRAFLINFVFFTPLASGMALWPAIVIASRGEWAKAAERWALIGLGFAPVSIVAFAALVFARSYWAGWIGQTDLPNAAWLDTPFLFARDAAALVALWVMLALHARRARTDRPKPFAGFLIVLYCAVWTLLSFDLVMALDPHWFSTLFGGYFFITGLYAAVVCWTLVTLIRRPDTQADVRNDLGRLIITFSMIATYTMFTQLLVIWYENLPAESRFVVPRLRGMEWRWVGIVLLVVVYLGPLCVLLTRWTRRTRWFLMLFTMIVLPCLWLERWWEVTPTLGGEPTLGLAELTITLAFAAAFVICVGLFDRRLPLAEVDASSPEPAGVSETTEE